MRLSLSWVELAGGPPDGRPLLIVGPSLGTSVATLWQACADVLAPHFRVLGWQLPGHGGATAATGFDLGDLAAAVRERADSELDGVPAPERVYHYAGDSVGGAVGLALALQGDDRLRSLVVLCSAARIATPSGWSDRAQAVRAGGTAVLVDSTPARWFAPGFAERHRQRSAALLADLSGADAASYAAVCDALATFDVRSRLSEIDVPVLAVAGDHDAVTPVAGLRQVADGVVEGSLQVLGDVAHLAPAEAPEQVAALIRSHAGHPHATGVVSSAQVRANGMRVRREVLGDAHVDRAAAGVTDFTADFQDFITGYAWGSVWTRPGLDRRSRSLITLTALVARGHHEELAMHVRAAIGNGVTEAELAELFLQCAIYCGVPDANAAFRIAQRTLSQMQAESDGNSGAHPG